MPSPRCPNFTCFTFIIEGCGHICIITWLFSANQQIIQIKRNHSTNTHFPWGPHTGESSFMVQRVLHFRIYEGTKSGRTKSNKVLLFLFSLYTGTFLFYMTIRNINFGTSCTSGHLFDPYDLSRHIDLFACLLFTICPWGIITIRMCMCSGRHCSHWTAYKGLWTGLLLPLYVIVPLLTRQLQISPAWPITRATITTTRTWVVLSLVVQLVIRVLLTPTKSILTEFLWVTQEARWAFMTTFFLF